MQLFGLLTQKEGINHKDSVNILKVAPDTIQGMIS